MEKVQIARRRSINFGGDSSREIAFAIDMRFDTPSCNSAEIEAVEKLLD